jgi:hypothetical protein
MTPDLPRKSNYNYDTIPPSCISERELLNRYRTSNLEEIIVSKKVRIVSQSKSMNTVENISDEILIFAYPTIRLCSLFPYRKPITYTERQVRGLFRSKQIRYIPERYIRFHLAMVACFYLILRYVRKGRKVNIFKFIRYNLPLYYTNEIAKEVKQDKGIMFAPSIIYEPDFVLPSSGKEYIQEFVKTNVSKYSRDFFSTIGKEGLYRIIRQIIC